MEQLLTFSKAYPVFVSVWFHNSRHIQPVKTISVPAHCLFYPDPAPPVSL